MRGGSGEPRERRHRTPGQGAKRARRQHERPTGKEGMAFGGRGLLGFVFVPLLALLADCRCDGECQGWDCVCPEGAACALECESPPCHVDCEGDNPSCEAECGNGDCNCGPGSHCDFTCHTAPCHVNCEGSSDCTGACANGTCVCAGGSDCAFVCDVSPCHVECEGDNPTCNGECANGSCTCGPNSACAFVCEDHNCHTFCGPGSACLLTCPLGTPGSQGCIFDECAAGEPTLCPDGITQSCGGAPCPEP